MGNAISNAASKTWNSVMKVSDELNADKLSNRLVEFGYNSGAGRIGGVAAGVVGAGGAAGATAVLLDKMNPLDTLQALPANVAEQSGALHKGVEIFQGALEFGAEVAVIGLTANFAVQSADATIDMIKASRHQSISLKDA